MEKLDYIAIKNYSSKGNNKIIKMQGTEWEINCSNYSNDILYS